MLNTSKGIVLRSIDYGETHKIVTLFTKQYGKLTAIARGAKKHKSRMAAITQPFVKSEFLLDIKKGLSVIRQGQIENPFREIREDIIKTAYASYISELSDKILDPLTVEISLYEQFEHTLRWIETKSIDTVIIPILMYELKLYEKGGFAPETKHCIQCGKINFPIYFSILEGGILCSNCAYIDELATELPDNMAKLIHIFKTTPLELVRNISVKKENQILLRGLLDTYYEKYGGYHLKTKKFLKQLKHLT